MGKLFTSYGQFDELYSYGGNRGRANVAEMSVIWDTIMNLIWDLEEHVTKKDIITSIEVILQLEDDNMVQDNTLIVDETYVILDKLYSIQFMVQH